ncbi:septal ring lytic transglycosylase RlpA family protein [Pararhodonellum marinum]|uniref:septal ring lytic transglycosylase RlpA family protein n=1 Tax=Pararhodonellum marinum TaxID=2755358 RepID=UPI0018907EB4|nr:septal ring lytic transglycosylase RlpA family protein [Pararhodonellum marinum]
MKRHILFFVLIGLFVSGDVHAQDEVKDFTHLLVIQKGTASYYGKKFHLRPTASGEIFHMDSLTAAHKHLPFGTQIRVVNQRNQKEVIVTINDRLPPSSKRVIDLSRAAASKINMVQSGLAPVTLSLLDFEAMEEVLAHYEEVPEEIRLRPYYETLEIPQSLERELP